MKTLFKNAKILDLDNECLITGSVEVVDNIITQVGSFDQCSAYDNIIDCRGNILMPGFVNTHCHTPMTLLRSYKEDTDLFDWRFNHILPTESKLTGEDVYWGQYLGILESVRAGITSIEEGYFHNAHIYNAIKKSGIRARIGFGPSSSRGPNDEDFLYHEMQEVLPATPLISNAMFVHAIYSINTPSIINSIKFSKKHNVPLSIHLQETKKEVEDCVATHGVSPTQYLHNLGFFDIPCICYHAVHVTNGDIKILRDNNVSIATCPSSNIKLASGIAPISKMLKSGINITIGTDGVASNNSLDMFKEMFLVSTLSKVTSNKCDTVKAIDVLKMATINGAKALGLNTGEIKVGKEADIILIDIDQPHYYPHSNLISHLVYAGKSSDVYLTMVAGKILYHNGKYFVGEEPNKIYENVNNIRQRLSKSN